MANIETIAYSSWDEFKSNCFKDIFHGPSFLEGLFIFRGQASSEWRLVSSFDRVFSDLPGASRTKISNELVNIFRKECIGFELPDKFLEDETVALSLGQHYGLPTRLLDWTKSPYIASFFAFSGAISKDFSCKSIALWAIDTRVESIWSGDNGVSIIDVPSFNNMRLRNQNGIFTLSKTPFSCLEEYIEYINFEATPLIKIVIPTSESINALSDLSAMGINYSRMYPELIGCALAAKTKVLLTYN